MRAGAAPSFVVEAQIFGDRILNGWGCPEAFFWDPCAGAFTYDRERSALWRDREYSALNR